MSYILDALKKADAERERGAVPGLRAQPVASRAPAATDTPSRTALTWAVAGVAAVVALGGAYWLGMGSGPTSPAPQPTAVASAAPKATVAPTPATPAPLPAAPTAPPATVATPAVTTVTTAPTTQPPSPKPAATTTPAQSGAGKTPASVPPAATQPAVATAPAPLLSELPADMRGQIPAIIIQGSVYSETPSQRLLLANGQVLNQGATLAPDLTVLEIGKGQSEFSFRGMRFKLAH